MKIERVKVQNFRSHRETEVIFKDGINLIIGQNGSGKSSLLDAILVGLYWPKASKKGLQKKDFTRVGTRGAKIEIFFEHDGIKYWLLRDMARNVAYLKRLENGEWKHVTEPTMESVANFMERLVPLEIFRNAIYVRQGEIEAILESDDARDRIVKKILNLDKVEMAYENLRGLIKYIKRRIQDREAFIERTKTIDSSINSLEKSLVEVLKEIKDVESKLPELKREARELEKKDKELDALKEEIVRSELNLEKLNSKRRGLEEKIKALEKKIEERNKRIKELEEVTKALGELEEKEKRFQKLKEFREIYIKEKSQGEKELERVESQIENIEGRLEDIAEKEEEAKRLREELRKLEQAKEEFEKVVKEYEEMKSKLLQLKRLKAKLKGIDPREIPAKIEKLEKERENIIEELSELKSRKGELFQRRRDREKAIEELKKARGKCPVCGRELTEEHKRELLQRYSLEVRKIGEELVSLSKREEELNREFERIERDLKELRGLKSIAEDLIVLEESLKEVSIDELEEKKKEYEEIRQRISSIKGKLSELEKELRLKEAFERKLERLKTIRDEVISRLGTLEEDLRSLGFSTLEELEGEIRELEKFHAEYIRAKKAEEDLKRELNLLRMDRKELDVAFEELAEVEEDIEGLERRIRDLKNKYSQGEHLKVKEELQRKKEIISAMNAKLEELKKREEETKRSLEELKKQRGEREKAEEEVRVLKNALKRAESLRDKIKMYKTIIKEEALRRIGEIASEIFAEFTEGKYSQVIVKAEENKVKLFVVYDGKEMPLTFLSGGEKIALGLAFRLAMSMYLIGKMSLLILDEPTPYLDEERRRKLVEIMERHLRKISQVIIVSHDEELRDAADYVIKLNLENGVSVLTIMG
ncbi:DNA double-strand break repair ATPase Rad50 [Pyrococcus kukulkanii]|uniref:DNA double-strand break repair ATPase Rad50 n=1 Tax=Pyrococcus kukulkanii TaxID=1609559 RepID=UPI0035684317